MKGYGRLIRNARESAGLSAAELAAYLGQTKGVVLNMESEATLPTLKQVNGLVAVLPLSAEDLLRAMGYHLSPHRYGRIPKQLLDLLAQLSPDQHQNLIRLLTDLRKAPPRSIDEAPK